jgi:hypothetical protein
VRIYKLYRSKIHAKRFTVHACSLTSRHVNDEHRIYTSMVSNLDGAFVFKHIPFLAKLLGPSTRPYSQGVHEALTLALVNLCNRYECSVCLTRSSPSFAYNDVRLQARLAGAVG